MENYVRQTNEQITYNLSNAGIEHYSHLFLVKPQDRGVHHLLLISMLPGLSLNICSKDLISLQIFWMWWRWKAENVCRVYKYIYFYVLWKLPIEFNALEVMFSCGCWLGMGLHGSGESPDLENSFSLYQTTLRWHWDSKIVQRKNIWP